MRWLVSTLAAAATLVALPAAAQTYGYGYGQPGYGYGSDFDYRRCYSGEREETCRERLRREADRYNGSRYDQGYQSYDRYGDYNRYGYGNDGYGRQPYYDPRGYQAYGYGYGNNGYGRQPYYDPRTYGGYGNGYGYDRGYYGGGYGRSDSSGLVLTILGIALGAQILGSLDDRDYWDNHRHDDGYRNWCRRQYPSFDWNSGTYMHQDGYRRYCRRG